MNLGAFAGGAASGYEEQQKLAQHQQELNDAKNFRDRQMAMSEQNQAWTEEQHNQQRAMQSDMQAVNNTYMNPQTTTNPDGTTSTIPPLDMNDPSQGARRLSYMTDMLGVKMKHTMDPTQLAPIMDYLDKARSTQFGQDVLGAMSGDQNKFNALVTRLGGDPSKANIDHDKLTLDLGNGKPPVDLQQYLVMGGADKALNGIVALRKEGREEQLTDAQTEHLGSQSNLQDVQASELVPAQAAQARAHASYFGARAAADQSAVAGLRASAALDKHVGQYVQPDAVTGKPDPVQKSFLTGYGVQLMSNGVKDPAQAALGANQKWNDLSKKADAYVDSLDIKNADKTALSKKFGSASARGIKAKIMQGFASSVAVPAPAAAPRSGNLGASDPDVQD